MDWAHIHILINHFPVVLVTTGALATILAVVLQRRGVWLYATVSLTLAGITVIPTYFTGQPADHALNDPWYVAKGAIDTHEQAAKISAILTVLAALVAVVAWRRLVRYPRELRMPRGLRTAIVVTSVAAATGIGYTSWLGGRIVHDAPGLKGPRPASAPASAPATVTPVTPDTTRPPGAVAPQVPAASPPAPTTTANPPTP
jgi:uncharacterized membrane protein